MPAAARSPAPARAGPPPDEDLYDLSDCYPKAGDDQLRTDDIDPDSDDTDPEVFQQRLADGWGLAFDDHTRWT